MARRGRTQFDKFQNLYFITTTVVGFQKILIEPDDNAVILVNSLKFVLKRECSELVAYVFMPHHIHLIVFVPEGNSITAMLRDFKKFTSSSIHKRLEACNEHKLISKLIRLSGTENYKLWMDRFDCQVIETEKVLVTKINYIHMNPVKAGLVKEMTDWKYSSARNYYLGDNSIMDVSVGWTF